MATIQIHRNHSLGREEMRSVVERMAADLRSRLQANYHWQGGSLLFERSGANGRIDVSERDLNITIELGFPLSAMKGMVESQINGYLDQNIR